MKNLAFLFRNVWTQIPKSRLQPAGVPVAELSGKELKTTNFKFNPMNKLVILLFWSLAFSQTLHAQAPESDMRQNNVELSFGLAENANMLRLSYTHYWGIGAKKRFQVGAGARLLTVFGDSWRMAEVNTSNNADGGEDENAILTNDITVGGVNAGLYLKYEISPKLEVGLNFDIIGIGFANEGGTDYVAAADGSTTAVTQTQSPAPNIAFTRGQVSSDNLWIGYNFSPKFQAKLGFNFTGVELEVEDLPEDLEDPRFERINTMLIIGVGYNF